MARAADASHSPVNKRAPIKDGFFAGPLSNLDEVRLQGSKCRKCGEVFLGVERGCQACQSTDLEIISLSNRGRLYSYTVIRNRPPGNYVGPEPFVPFAVGLVELPEGIRLISPLKGCDVDNLKVDAEVELVADRLYDDDTGNEVIGFAFKPV